VGEKPIAGTGSSSPGVSNGSWPCTRQKVERVLQVRLECGVDGSSGFPRITPCCQVKQDDTKRPNVVKARRVDASRCKFSALTFC
jgi:hypothetical protein